MQGSWFLFGFQITTPFVCGVGLVILSIFIYGAKADQVTGWIDAVKAKLGMRSEYNLVAQMEPLNEEMQEAQGPSRA